MTKGIRFLSLLFLLFHLSCSKNSNIPNNSTSTDTIKKTIVVLYTNDEHGWMEPTDKYDGAAGLFELWKTKEGYNGADSILILSGGDMWAGPAISTWFKGKSMVEVMNAMEYDAAAIGNHEFDYTVDTLKKRLQEMNFPLLAANIIEKSTDKIPSFVQPYIIEDAGGVKVGIIGLAYEGTPFTTFPTFVEDYEFTSYSDAIIKYAPIAKSEGAEILIVLGHIVEDEMDSLAPVAKAQGVSLLTGGHEHRKVLKNSDGLLVIEAGANMRNYIKVVLEYNKTIDSVTIVSSQLVENTQNKSNTEIETVVASWRTRTQTDLAEVIGYCSEKIPEQSVQMGNMVTDSWLFAYPNADIAMTNATGIRQDLEQGEITLESIIGVLPFTNTLLELDLTGTEVIDCLGNLLVAGMKTKGGYFHSDGTPIKADSVYSVLTTDYLYYLNNSKFAKYDPEPVNTSISYAQPTIDWIKSKNTTAQNPINNYLDNTPRR